MANRLQTLRRLTAIGQRLTESRKVGLKHSGASYKLISGARLIDGRESRPIESGAVLVEGSQIIAVGPADKVAPPEGVPVEVLDFAGKSIMPGMIDCHTHHNGFGDGRLGDTLKAIPDEVLTLQSARNARAALFSGVTTIRENGPKNDTMFRLRDGFREGIGIGPRMVLCGRAVTIVGGHLSYFGPAITGPVEARAMVRRLIKEGADYIKIMATGGSTLTSNRLRPSFEVEELRAIADEAHKFGKLTAAHCLSTQGIVNCLDANVDMIIHCVFQEPDGSNRFREDVAERIAKQGASVNPTLHVFRARVWAQQFKKAQQGLTSEEQTALDDDLRYFDVRLDHCKRMIDLGVKLVTGSDSSWGDYQLGNTPYETECLVMAGYSNAQGVRSVTGDAAASLGVDGETGTLEPGKAADILVVDGDPHRDITRLWNVNEVFLGGRRIDRGSQDSRAATRQHPPP